MKGRKILLLIACGVLAITSIGCATTTGEAITRIIDPETLEKIVENPSEFPLSLDRGETIEVTLKEETELFSVNVSDIKLTVGRVDTTSISGDVIGVFGENGWNYKVKGKEAKIMISDVERIWVFSKVRVSSRSSGDDDSIEELVHAIWALLLIPFMLWVLGL